MIPENIELKMLRGSDIVIDNEIKIKSYTISEIIDGIGIENYNSYVSYIASSPYDLRSLIYENGEKLYTEISHWDLFIDYFFNSNKKHFHDALYTILDIDISTYKAFKNEDKVILVSDNGNEIDEFKFNYISNIVREINGYPKKSNEPNFANRTATIYEIERNTRRIKKGRKLNGDTNLKTIISALSWTDSPIGIKEVWDLTFYQLYDGLKSTQKRDRYENLMFGIYAGNVKQESINFNKENWFNK